MKPDKRGINRLITAIANAPAKELRMRYFTENLYTRVNSDLCGTAHCIAGWAKAIRDPKGVIDKESAEEALARLLFGNTAQKSRVAIYPLWIGSGISLHLFDELPPAKRKQIALDVLANFRDTGVVNWRMFSPRRIWSNEELENAQE